MLSYNQTLQMAEHTCEMCIYSLDNWAFPKKLLMNSCPCDKDPVAKLDTQKK